MAISNAHFAKLRDFITLRLPPGFPVKIGGCERSSQCGSISCGCGCSWMSWGYLTRTQVHIFISNTDSRPVPGLLFCATAQSWFLQYSFIITIGHWCCSNNKPFTPVKKRKKNVYDAGHCDVVWTQLSVLQRFPCFTCWTPEWRSVTCAAATSRSARWRFTNQRAPERLVTTDSHIHTPQIQLEECDVLLVVYLYPLLCLGSSIQTSDSRWLFTVTCNGQKSKTWRTWVHERYSCIFT